MPKPSTLIPSLQPESLEHRVQGSCLEQKQPRILLVDAQPDAPVKRLSESS